MPENENEEAVSETFTLTDISQSYALSRNGVLTIGGGKLGGFKNGSLSIESDSTDNSTRDDQGWSKTDAGKRTATLEVTYNIIASDVVQNGIRALATTNDFNTKGVTIAYSTASTGGSSFSGTFRLTSYSETQEKDGEAIEAQATFESYGAVTATNPS